jgi:hypothetical protein
MPTYFEVRSPDMPITRSAADALAPLLQSALEGFNVRVVSIKRHPPNAFVFACAMREKRERGVLVECLRRSASLAALEISTEAGSSDGPFRWSNPGT